MPTDDGGSLGEENPAEEKSKRPDERAFFQQRLPGWEPVMTAEWGAGVFLVFGIISLSVGIPLLVASNGLHEEIIHYGDECKVEGTGELCQDFLKDPSNLGKVCNCSVSFQLEKDLEGDIFMYYGMSNFYQNHRQYAKSRDYLQLRGQFRNLRERKQVDNIHEDCKPLRYYPNDTDEAPFIPYAPCGLIANSLFNDSISLEYEPDGGSPVPVALTKRGIAWSTDYNDLFINPPGETLEIAFNGTEKPPYWQKEPWQLDLEDEENNGYKNEDFIVWMRAAVFPSFRKLYRKITHTAGGNFEKGLPAGTYKLNVQYAFPVDVHEGDKTVILTNLSWAGGKNPFLGILSIVLSVICFILCAVFVFLHLYTKDWDRELEATVLSQQSSKQGIDNPAMAGRGNKVDDDSINLTPDAWRRRLSRKGSTPQTAANGNVEEKGGLLVRYQNQDIVGHSDQGMEILGMTGANTEGADFVNGSVASQSMSVWM